MWTQFFSMGKYGIYVWPSFGVVLFVLSYHWYASIKHHRQTILALQQEVNQEPSYDAEAN